ncbi:MAG: MaoC family dehydratase [Bacteroidales bacterium]|jgi:3-hydroxybutyryl-CoA dehydratase|nr:MaoC family dehydratase [Bacteroidales bacterium]
MAMKLSDLYIGQEERMSAQFSMEKVKAFANITGDFNPIHLDPVYATQTIFKENIVHGFLVASLFSTILGTKMPGEGSIYLKQNMKFVKPVYIDDTVTAVVSITDINFEKQLVTLNTTCHNQDGVVVIEGDALVKKMDA